MSKKDKEVPSKEIAQEKEAESEIEEALELAKKEEEVQKRASELTQEQIIEMMKKAEEGELTKERLLRLQADFENHKKRLARDKEEFLKYAKADLIESLLPVMDNFDLALKHAEKDHDPKHIVQGIQMIRKLFGEVFKKEGLEPIDSVDVKFNPDIHEAIGFEESEEKEEGLVTEIVQTGYKLNHRLIRPAKVKITKKKS